MNADAAYFTHRRPEMLDFLPAKRRRVLEIGCAQGEFLSAVPGVEERWGIEPSPAARLAQSRLDKVFESTFDAAEPELPAHYFDIVICNDVIEHMPDHDVFFSRISRYIAPGGTLIGSIPNVRFYKNLFELIIEKDWNYTDSGILDRTHTRFFTEKSLRKSFARHGFSIERFAGLDNAGRPRDGRPRLYYLASRALIALSLGYFSDIQFLQFGFRVKPGGQPTTGDDGGALDAVPHAVQAGAQVPEPPTP